jgi:hypothetical protein
MECWINYMYIYIAILSSLGSLEGNTQNRRAVKVPFTQLSPRLQHIFYTVKFGTRTGRKSFDVLLVCTYYVLQYRGKGEERRSQCP